MYVKTKQNCYYNSIYNSKELEPRTPEKKYYQSKIACQNLSNIQILPKWLQNVELYKKLLSIFFKKHCLTPNSITKKQSRH